MSEQDLTARLIDLAAKRFKKSAESLKSDDDFFQALGIDSMQAMELLTEIEEHFEVEVPDYELQGVTTFAGLAEVVKRRVP
ncbi:MAG: acyl carrier protein [Sandaracinaceae bacterium]|nr:acyl carrier protein [Sandaracinaceae bacterium]